MSRLERLAFGWLLILSGTWSINLLARPETLANVGAAVPLFIESLVVVILGTCVAVKAGPRGDR